jgi:hypothetical protein
MLQIETLVGMTKTMLADEDFIETFASHSSKVNRRNRIKEYAAEMGTPLETIAERESVRLLIEHTLSEDDSKRAAYSLEQMLQAANAANAADAGAPDQA